MSRDFSSDIILIKASVAEFVKTTGFRNTVVFQSLCMINPACRVGKIVFSYLCMNQLVYDNWGVGAEVVIVNKFESMIET